MKKQQTPVVLIALLVVFGGAMIAMRQRPANAPTDPTMGKGVTGEAREGVKSADLAKNMKEKVAPKSAAMLAPDEVEARSEPAILLPDTEEYIPTPNSTSTSSQWFKGDKKKDPN